MSARHTVAAAADLWHRPTSDAVASLRGWRRAGRRALLDSASELNKKEQEAALAIDRSIDRSIDEIRGL